MLIKNSASGLTTRGNEREYSGLPGLEILREIPKKGSHDGP
jgi:hypothetical protein